jgi:hypothetical protein
MPARRFRLFFHPYPVPPYRHPLRLATPWDIFPFDDEKAPTGGHPLWIPALRIRTLLAYPPTPSVPPSRFPCRHLPLPSSLECPSISNSRRHPLTDACSRPSLVTYPSSTTRWHIRGALGIAGVMLRGLLGALQLHSI